MSDKHEANGDKQLTFIKSVDWSNKGKANGDGQLTFTRSNDSSHVGKANGDGQLTFTISIDSLANCCCTDLFEIIAENKIGFII